MRRYLAALPLIYALQALADDQRALQFYEKGMSQERAGNLEAAQELYKKAIKEKADDGQVKIPGTIENRWIETPRGMKLQKIETGGSVESYYPNQRLARVQAQLDERRKQQQADETRRYKFANPPMLTLTVQFIDSDRSNSVSGGEQGKLIITAHNNGKSAADDVTVSVSVDNRELELDGPIRVGRIEPGSSVVKSIAFEASKRLKDGKAIFTAKATERDGFDAPKQAVAVQTEPFKAPELLIGNATIVPGSGTLNYLTYEIRNQGEGAARDVKVELLPNSKVILENERDQLINVGTLPPGGAYSFKIGFYSSFAPGEQAPFSIRIKEQDPENHVSTQIAAVMPSRSIIGGGGITTLVASATTMLDNVSAPIPEGADLKPFSFGLVIGNKNYEYLDPVRFADNDARVVGNYLVKTMGFPQRNVQVIQDMRSLDFKRMFGTRDEGFKNGELYARVQLNKRKTENPAVFIYYSGHGAPAQNEDGRAYLVPVDAAVRDIQYAGYRLEDFYDAIAALPTTNVTVVLDSCFSGQSNDGLLQKDISPAMLKVAKAVTPTTLSNASVFTSTAPNQVSYWHEQAGHSLFTYHFLRGLQGRADDPKEGGDGDGQVTAEELHSFLSWHVEEFTINRPSAQTPLLVGNKQQVLAKYAAQ